MQSNIQQYYSSFYTFYESHFFPGQTPVPPRSGTCIPDLSHDPIWAIWLAEVRKFHQHHDRMSHPDPAVIPVGTLHSLEWFWVSRKIFIYSHHNAFVFSQRCPSCMLCPLCNVYSSGWIRSILGTNDHYHERVCRAPWSLTLTYIFKVIQAWLCDKTAKICPSHMMCPLCNVYSFGWILSIFGTNDQYHESVCCTQWHLTLTYIFKVIHAWFCNKTC